MVEEYGDLRMPEKEEEPQDTLCDVFPVTPKSAPARTGRDRRTFQLGTSLPSLVSQGRLERAVTQHPQAQLRGGGAEGAAPTDGTLALGCGAGRGGAAKQR